jgi:hypothetical protein
VFEDRVERRLEAGRQLRAGHALTMGRRTGARWTALKSTSRRDPAQDLEAHLPGRLRPYARLLHDRRLRHRARRPGAGPLGTCRGLLSSTDPPIWCPRYSRPTVSRRSSRHRRRPAIDRVQWVVVKTRSGNRSRTMGGYWDAWVTKSHRIEPAVPGRCTRCGAHLSIYRSVGATQCSPCDSAAHVGS